MRIGLILLLLLTAISASALNYKIIWEEEVDQETAQKARVWLDTLVSASFRINGQYPDTLNFYLHQVNTLKDGVGWAYVKYPKKSRGVYMDVNAHVSLDTLLSNWEPPHEISHLAMPFMGKENKWISEGFATYMSRHVMLGLGIYDDETIIDFYHQSFKEVAEYYQTDETFESVVLNLVATGRYYAFYRGGAMYFYVCDYFIFERNGIRLRDVVREYQSTHKKMDTGFDMMIDSLDGLIGEPILRKTLYFFKTTSARAIINFVLTH